MIKSLVVKGLWGRYDYDLQFNEDVNIFTGSNGTGKTTLLKMLWYVYSGNYEQLMREIFFLELTIIFSDYEFIIKQEKRNVLVKKSATDTKPQVEFREYAIGFKKENDKQREKIFAVRLVNGKHGRVVFESEVSDNRNSSYFFPTFRRIEGGFSLQESTDLVNALAGITTKMTVENHRFITSSNSEDIRGIVNEISSDIRLGMEVINKEFMDFIAQQINGDSKSPSFTEELKEKIKQKEADEAKAKEAIDNLSLYIDRFFWEKSVKISEELKLGQHDNEIHIENLSAGEKNFLSFLVYATSLQEGVIFIDEPELNLHIDWQRALVATLRDIAPNVQLFMASHSPGIYTNYSDKAPWFNDIMKPHIKRPIGGTPTPLQKAMAKKNKR